MNDLYNRIERLCNDKGVKIGKMCSQVGISRGNLSDLKHGRTQDLSTATLAKIADYFNVSVDYLVGKEDRRRSDFVELYPTPNEEIIHLPVIGSVSAGYNCTAIEEYTGDYILYPLSMLKGSPDDYFVLQVKGDSMYPQFLAGDRVLVRKCTLVENGKIAVVMYNGDEATIKKVEYEPNKYIKLIPANPEYMEKCITGEDMNECRILGEVKQLIREM